MKKFWEHVKTFEPAMLHGIIISVVGIAGLWGLDLADAGEKVTQTWTLAFPLLAVVQAWWTRGAVYSPGAVAKIEADLTPPPEGYTPRHEG